MKTLHNQLLKADRLTAVTQSVGFALWQLQELEGTCAQYFVLVAHAKPGMGLDAGLALVDKAQSKTFGSTVTQLAKAKQLPQEIEDRFKVLLAERNWLVHSSRSSSRNAIHDDHACEILLNRLEKIAEEARLLLSEIGKSGESFVKRHGLSTVKIDALAADTLRQWHGEDAL